jgi:hypothetical protein
MPDRCYNLLDSQSRALLAGATVLVRPVHSGLNLDDYEIVGLYQAEGREWKVELQHRRLGYPECDCITAPWHSGDVLVGRESFSWAEPWCIGQVLLTDQGGICKFWKCTGIWYWADGNPPAGDWTRPLSAARMRAEDARHRLPVVSVEARQLGKIDEETWQAAGHEPTPIDLPSSVAEAQWTRDHGKRHPWDPEAWAWVVTVER